ncbi:unnamed protein product, partial [marine sediment metagenome]
RAEITQLGGHADLEKTEGWNAFEFTSATGGMFYYGEGVSGTDNIAVAGTQYTWSQFISDALFKTWDIYRITLEYGWEASGSFGDVYVADLQLNGKMIPLKPDIETQLEASKSPPALVTVVVNASQSGTMLHTGAAKLYWVLYTLSTGNNASCKLTDGTSGGTAPDFTIRIRGELTYPYYFNPPIQYTVGIRHNGLTSMSELVIGYVAD